MRFELSFLLSELRWEEREETEGAACNNDLSFFISISDDVGPRLEPDHALRELTHSTEIHHMGQKVDQRHEYWNPEDLCVFWEYVLKIVAVTNVLKI